MSVSTKQVGLIVTNKDEKITIPFHSPICESISTLLSMKVINEIKNIHDGILLSEDAVNFMYVTKLDYLLYNFKIKYVTENPYLKEIQSIKEDLIPVTKLYKLLKRFWGYEDYLVIDFCDKIDLLVVISLGFINILDYVHRRYNFRNISILVDECCKYDNIKMIRWFYINTRFDYTELAIDNSAKNGHLEIIDWFFQISKDKKHEFKYKNAINLAKRNGHTDILDWFNEKLFY
jgi:hypothetical protein